MNCKLIGLLLPCNVVDYEDPEMMVQATGRTDLEVLQKVYEKDYKMQLIQFELK